jgi:hypothetical protein
MLGRLMSDVSSPRASSEAGPPGRAGASLWVRLWILVSIAFLAGISLYLCRPPAPKPASAPAAEFSAERALEHVRAIAKVPRPTGSPANREAREHILGVLRGEGLSPEVQEAAVRVSSWGRTIPGGVIHNIVATLPGSGGAGSRILDNGNGSETTPLVLLVSHYDSVAVSPGASDDGAGVAAMLEALRALRAGPRLAGDIGFLFTDAEELGLAGAEQFAAHHPLAKRAGVVLNFEARGASGPVYMFETSEGSEDLIEALAASGAPVFANSLSAVVYRLMPNATDFTIFRRRGVRGMAFAYIGGLRHYHSPSDTLENLDKGSLQHHGEYMVGLARRLAGEERLGAEGSPARGRDAIYFNAVGSIFISYSSVWALPLAGLSALAFGAAIRSGARRKSLRLDRAAVGFAALLGSLFAAFFVVLLAWLAARALDPRFRPPLSHRALDDGFYMVAVALLAAGALTSAGAIASRWARPAELLAGHLAGWLLFSAASAIWLKGGSHLAAWPLLFGAAGLYALTLSKEGAIVSWKSAAIVTASAAPAILLLTPTLNAVLLALSLAAAPAVAPLIALFLGLLWPCFAAVMGHRKQLVSIALLAAGALLTAARALLFYA